MHTLRREGVAVPPPKIKPVMTTRTPPRYAPEPGSRPGDHPTYNNETCCPLQAEQPFQGNAGDYNPWNVTGTESPERDVTFIVFRL